MDLYISKRLDPYFLYDFNAKDFDNLYKVTLDEIVIELDKPDKTLIVFYSFKNNRLCRVHKETFTKNFDKI